MAIDIGTRNAWRLESPGHRDWARSPAPDAENKYLLVDVDSHANEPMDLWSSRLPAEYHDRLPHVTVDETGNQWIHIEGWRPQMVKPAGSSGTAAADSGNVWTDALEPDDLERMSVSSTSAPDEPGLAVRHRDAARDGIDAAVVFPGRGLLAYATPDPDLSLRMARAWNDWAWDLYGPHNDRFAPMAMIVPSDLDAAVVEVERAAATGFRGLLLPCRPVSGDVQDRRRQYNSRDFDPLWSAVEASGLPVMFHVATGRDPRAASGPGGAAFNLVLNSVSQVIEPLAYLLVSGALEAHPDLVVGTVEGGASWLLWLLPALDDAVRKHHMWNRPVLAEPPSVTYRRQCFSTFIEEDPTVMATLEALGLTGNIMWSSDYPHQEGSWPHSQEAIERQLGHLSEEARVAVLGSTAGRIFGFTPAGA